MVACKSVMLYISSPFGVDSNPLKDMVALYAPTGEKGETTIIGYLNKNQLAGIGENRLFSLKENGDLATYIWMKNDETMEIGGDSDNMVRYAPLNSGVQQFKSDVNIELVKIAAVLNTIIPNSYPPPTLSIDISNSKIDEIKTI